MADIKTKKRKLTVKERLFCNEYLKDFNITKAAIRTGYSEKTAYSIGWELLRKPEISAEIARLKKDRIARVAFDADDFFNTLINYIKTDVNDFFDIDRKGAILLKDLKKIDGTLISEIRQNKYGITVKLQDKAKALEMLARHLNLFKEDQESGAANFKVILEQLDEEAQQIVKSVQNSKHCNTDDDDVQTN